MLSGRAARRAAWANRCRANYRRPADLSRLAFDVKPSSQSSSRASCQLPTLPQSLTTSLPRTFARRDAGHAHRFQGSVRAFHSTASRAAKKRVEHMQKQMTDAVQTKKMAVNDFLQTLPAKTQAAMKAAFDYILLHTMRAVKDPRLLWEWTKWAWHGLVHFCKHMWLGSRLLAANVRISSKLFRKSFSGKKLLRREERLMLRTVSDIGRLIPFSFFILVPFMELLLPVALKVFPSLLPTTFEDADQKEASQKKTLKTRLTTAKLLQEGLEKRLDVLTESDDASECKVEAAQEFKAFMEKIRKGLPLEKDDITKNARWFRDEFTMDGLKRSQLQAMCQFMGIPTYGGDGVLRFQIRHKLRKIQADDRQIHWEGIKSLSTEDLVEANHDRGMPHEGLTRDCLENQLKRWLALSMNSAVPASLLILSRTYVLRTTDQDTAGTGDALKAAIKSMPKNVVEEIQEELADEVLEAIEQKKKVFPNRQVSKVALDEKDGEEVDESHNEDLEEIQEDLEELAREEALIKEEAKLMADKEEKEQLRQAEMAAMQKELADISFALNTYDERLKSIMQATHGMMASTEEEMKSMVDVVEDMVSREEERERLLDLKKKGDGIILVADETQGTLHKHEADATQLAKQLKKAKSISQ